MAKNYSDKYSYQVLLDGNSIPHEGFLHIYLDDFAELSKIQECIQNVRNKWADPNDKDVELPINKRGGFNYLYLESKNQQDRVISFGLEIGYANPQILDLFFQHFDQNTKSIKKILISYRKDF